MKKVKVLFDFYDKFHTSTHYKVGDVVEFEDERANDVISRGLAKAVKSKADKTDKPEDEDNPDPDKGKDAKGDEGTNTPDTNEGANTDGTKSPDTNEGKDVKGDGLNDNTDEEKRKASEKKAAELIAKVNKK